jgi:hypothetical protein
LDIVTGTIQIAKSSAKLWATVEMGGESMHSTSIADDEANRSFKPKKIERLKL